VAGSWRRLHNEEFHNLYVSSNIIRAIKQMTMRWAEIKNAYNILDGKSERKNHSEDTGVDGG
jgi:hypothetical protein